MNLILRLLKVLIAALWRPRLAPGEASVLDLRVWPNDLDANMHMNNSRYLAVMDLGRVDLMVRGGIAGVVRRQRWMPVVASVAVRYRRSLRPFERYRLSTRLLGWDEKWLYVEQIFETMDGRIAAIGLVRGAFRDRSGAVPTSEIARVLGSDPVSPPLPPHVVAWEQAERQLFDRTATDRLAA